MSNYNKDVIVSSLILASTTLMVPVLQPYIILNAVNLGVRLATSYLKNNSYIAETTKEMIDCIAGGVVCATIVI